MVAIMKDERGRYVVGDDRRVYGVYRSEVMALYRVRQLVTSRGQKKPAK